MSGSDPAGASGLAGTAGAASLASAPDLAAPTLKPECQELSAPSTMTAASGVTLAAAAGLCAALPQTESEETGCASSTTRTRSSRNCSSRPACPAAWRGTSSSPWHVLPPAPLLLATPPPEPACRGTAPLRPAHLLLPPMPWQQFPFSRLSLGTNHNTGHRWTRRVLQDAHVTVPALPMPANHKSNATS